jgi:hypothetical protein
MQPNCQSLKIFFFSFLCVFVFVQSICVTWQWQYLTPITSLEWLFIPIKIHQWDFVGYSNGFVILFWSNFIRNVNCYAIPKNFTNFFFFSFLLGRIADPVDGSWIANPERLYAKIRRLEFWHPGLGNSHIRYVEQTTAGFLLFHMTYEQVGCYSHSYHKKKIYIFQMHSNGKNF